MSILPKASRHGEIRHACHQHDRRDSHRESRVQRLCAGASVRRKSIDGEQAARQSYRSESIQLQQSERGCCNVKSYNLLTTDPKG